MFYAISSHSGFAFVGNLHGFRLDDRGGGDSDDYAWVTLSKGWKRMIMD